MEIKLLASNVGNASLDSALLFAGKMAGVCYMKDSMESFLQEPPARTMSRVKTLLDRKHHSPFEHVEYTFALNGIPKILAMILNNEKVYSTSEKSARFTQMKVYGLQADFYNKWREILQKQISHQYPDFPDAKVSSLAQENARYGISVFSPSTEMVYTTNLRQLNYVLSYIEEYSNCCKENLFNHMLLPFLDEFCEKMKPWRLSELTEQKNYSLSLFAQRRRGSEYGEVYSTSYTGSFAQFAQAQRHRTISYELMVPEENEWRFYVPAIIKSNLDLKREWISDMLSISRLYPQGLLVQINERGTLENFLRKCHERLCGTAQLEIMEQTRQTLHRYYSSTKATMPFIANQLAPYLDRPRCKFGYKCSSPCCWGPENAFSRQV